MKKELPTYRFDNLYAVAISFVTMVLAVSALYWGLSNKIDLLTQKVEYLIQNQNEYFQRNKEVQTRLGRMEVKISVLESKGE